MTFRDGKTFFIFGMGKSGRAAARLLAQKGYDVVVYDENKEILDDFIRPGGAEKFLERITGAVPDDAIKLLENSDRMVLSPGVPLDHPLVTKAKEIGKPVDGEIEAAYHFTDARLVGVTATNGKSTTVGIIGEILQTAGVRTVVAGNIGNPFAEVVSAEETFEAIVLELSSFQLDTITEFKAEVAVLLNVTPDHLDRYHGSFDEYAASKARILNRSDETTSFIYNHDDTVCRRIADGFDGRKIAFSSTTRLENGVYLDGENIQRSWNGRTELILRRAEFNPVGIHNAENAMAAVAAATPFEPSLPDIRAALRSYRPLAHRMELVRVIDGVGYVNDSKATNVDAAVKSLQSIAGGAILIIGGKDKDGEFRTLIPYLNHVRAAILIGEAGDAVRSALDGHCTLKDAADMDDAVKTASGLAQAGDTVLLAPACASFDMFKNYQDRGEVFRACVHSLPQREG